MRGPDLIWTRWNEEHVALHGVDPGGAEEIVAGRYHMRQRRGNRYGAIAQTLEGRYLTVIVDRRDDGTFFVVTARDADQDERRLYHRHRPRR